MGFGYLNKDYTLSTSATNGSVALNPRGGNYFEGTEVTLTATPKVGYEFSGWSGNLTDTVNPVTIIMDAYKSVTANFISNGVISVNGVAIDDCPSRLFLAGETFQFTATVFPDDADDLSVSWSSSDTLVATVDSSGFLSTLSMGNAIITITANDVGYTDQCIVLVDYSEVNNAKMIDDDHRIKVYPNPVSKKLYFILPESSTEKLIKIYNTNSQLLISKKTFATHFEIDVEKFKAEELLIAHIVFDQNSVFKKVLLER